MPTQPACCATRPGTYTYSNVENFISDALVFGEKFGLSDALDPNNQHNCDETGKVWRDSGGNLRGLGNLPCYSYYSQTMGPTDWHLSTNDWAGYATAQWQRTSWWSLRRIALGAGAVAAAHRRAPESGASADGKAAQPGQQLGSAHRRGRGNRRKALAGAAAGLRNVLWAHENATLETALTQTGSLNGDLSFFMRPTDDPERRRRSAVSLRAGRRAGQRGQAGSGGVCAQLPQSEVHQAVAAVEETLPGHVEVTASAMVSLGRRLPISIDTNFDPAVNPGNHHLRRGGRNRRGTHQGHADHGSLLRFLALGNLPPGFAGRLNPDYQQITQIMSRANSTYEAAMLKVDRYGRRGLSLHAHYTYAHAMDWNPNESAQVAGNDVLDPPTSAWSTEPATWTCATRPARWQSMRRRGSCAARPESWQRLDALGRIGQFRSGLPYTMRTSGSLAEEFTTPGAAIVGLGPGMNGSGGDNRVYGMGDNIVYNIGRNTYRYPATWKADLRLGKRFDLGQMRQLELLAESFNLFNHQNVTELETTGYYLESGSTSSLPTLNFLTGLKANTTAFGQPLNINATNFYRERQFQFGLRMRFYPERPQ
jgi:hypothetical protein